MNCNSYKCSMFKLDDASRYIEIQRAFIYSTPSIVVAFFKSATGTGITVCFLQKVEQPDLIWPLTYRGIITGITSIPSYLKPLGKIISSAELQKVVQMTLSQKKGHFLLRCSPNPIEFGKWQDNIGVWSASINWLARVLWVRESWIRSNRRRPLSAQRLHKAPMILSFDTFCDEIHQWASRTPTIWLMTIVTACKELIFVILVYGSIFVG